jgi:hypothetical protein
MSPSTILALPDRIGSLPYRSIAASDGDALHRDRLEWCVERRSINKLFVANNPSQKAGGTDAHGQTVHHASMPLSKLNSHQVHSNALRRPRQSIDQKACS